MADPKSPPRDADPPEEEVLLPFTVRRAVPKIGRNDPCHCGSGKKYKRCCLEKDRTRLADPSPYPGLTMEEAKRDPSRHGDAGIFWEMSPEERAAVGRSALSPALLLGLFDANLDHGELKAAVAILDEVSARGGQEAADLPFLLDALVYEALRRGELAFAREHAARRAGEPTVESELNQVTLELSQKVPRGLRRLESLVRQFADDQAALTDAADALALAALPGTALLAARAAAAVRSGNVDGAILDDLLHEQREALELKGEDPARRLIEERARGRTGRHSRARASRFPDEGETEALRAQLLEREAAIQRMRSERDRLAGELSRRTLVENSGAGARAEEPTDEETRRLRRKIEELQAEMRRGQQERLDLRRELRTLAPTATGGEAARPSERPALDEDEGETVDPESLGDDAAVQPVAWTDAFYESAAGLDGRLVLRAQEVAVRFAGLDPATWKQAKKMADLTGVFTLRVGIHHRLFITRRDGKVAARELVPREAFERTLKRYRR